MPGDDTTVHTNNALNRLLDEYMDKRVVRVVHGGVEVSKTMLEQRFDLIFCTGGTFIGKIVAAAAAKTLTPTILELGGKSPAIIDETCDLEVSARRIAWGSFINSGQTCLRPDYVLVSSKIGDRFVALLEKSLRSFFGDDALQSEDYGRLVNTRQFGRIAAMIEQDKRHIAHGGSTNATEQYVEPTLLNFKNDIHAFTNAASHVAGGLWPSLANLLLDDCIDFVNSRERPLGLYMCTSISSNRNRVLRETTSGSVCINDATVQFTNSSLPFGGVGHSGMGAYHGKYSFDAFSHKKSVMIRSTWFDVKQRYYPYSPASLQALKPAVTPITRKVTKILKFIGGVLIIAVVTVAIVLLV
ncbi:hypothetical protein Poli38472_002674 [Pythium oligandrum]|uniref:Aldehyde dehydrogenase domain-containing protein n=1 Tax=Pythium oligandrum TaxID=41045 RepID=A0A8K1FMK0_PYTOL|nr:hypothetical protein Poli38472_002674 [Pythium oligandrum]|eukprot:TMW63733.1 hypothetical protein Poli38472_002674 [Pythium oligandrum]